MRTEQIHPSGPPWPIISYSSLDPCPRCRDGDAVPDPGRAQPACTAKGCGERTAGAEIDPTADRTSLEAHHEGVERWLGALVDEMAARGYPVDVGVLCDAQYRAEADLKDATDRAHALGIGNPSDPS